MLTTSDTTTGTETREPAQPAGDVEKGAPIPELEARVAGDATKDTESRELAFSDRYLLPPFLPPSLPSPPSPPLPPPPSLPLLFNLNNTGRVSEVVVATC